MAAKAGRSDVVALLLSANASADSQLPDGGSPLLAASGVGGKSGSKMMSTLATLLAYQRRAKKVYRAIKPYIPLLFWAVVLWCARPYLLAHVVPLVRPYLPSWAQSCFSVFGAAGAGCETVATEASTAAAAAAVAPIVDGAL